MKFKFSHIVRTFVALFMFSITTAATAANYNAINTNESEVNFTYKQMGVSMQGTFNSFQGNIDFDTSSPENGKANFEIEIASVDTGTTDGNEEVAGSDWFAIKTNPKASFESDSITPTSESSFDVKGTLSIKGIQQEVLIPVTYIEQGDTGVFAGEFVINRGDFNIGEGSWSSFDIVANEVTINISITAISK